MAYLYLPGSQANARQILKNGLIDVLSASAIEAKKGSMSGYGYYFSERCNPAFIHETVTRTAHENEAAIKWRQSLKLLNGQKKAHATVSWAVNRRLSTTCLVIVDKQGQRLYYDVYRNYDPKAGGLERLARQNLCFGDFTVITAHTNDRMAV